MSDPDQSELELYDADWELRGASQRRAQLAHRIGGVNVIDAAKVQSLGELPATRKILLLTLLLAVKDRATELRFETCRDESELALAPNKCRLSLRERTFFRGAKDDFSGKLFSHSPLLRMFYEIDGQFHELVPAPALLAPFLFREVATIAGLDTLRGRFVNLLRRLASRIDGRIPPPRQGGFRLHVPPYETGIAVWFSPSGRGDRLSLRLPVMPDALAERAGAEIGRLLDPYAHLLQE